MPLAPKPIPESRRRTPQHKAAHYTMIAVSAALALGVGVWLVVAGMG